MSFKLSFDPTVYNRLLDEYGKEVLQALLHTWVTKEQENIKIVNNHNLSSKQFSLEQTNMERSMLPVQKNIMFGSANREHLEIQDYYDNFECQENFDSEIIPRISLSPMYTTTSYSFLKPLPKIKQMIKISCENNTISKDNPLRAEDDSEEIIPATILDASSLDLQCKLGNFKCRYKTPQDKNNMKPYYSKINMPIKENISIETISKIFTDVNTNKDISNNNRNLITTSEHEEITWDNMIDEKVFGLSLEKPIENNDANKEKPAETVIAQTDKIVQNKNKLASTFETYSKIVTTLVDDKVKKTCAKELDVSFDTGRKRKCNEQKKIGDVLNKKVKNTATKVEKIDPTRKKKSKSIVNDWLKRNADERTLETNDTKSDEINPTGIRSEPKTLNSMDTMKQTRLVNIGGVMKFSNRDIESQNNVIPKKSDSMDKIRKKSKFIAPFKSQIPVSDTIYEIGELLHKEALSTFQSEILSKETVVIAMTIVYREGFCQLNKNFNGIRCSPGGLMICCNKSAFYYIPILNKNINNTNEFRQFIANLMSTPIRKICFEAQDLVMLFADLFKFEHKKIYLKWKLEDPKVKYWTGQSLPFVFMELRDQMSRHINVGQKQIGCFLLDPDKTAESFPELQSQIGVYPEFTISSACVKQKTVWLLTILVDCADKIILKLKDNALTKIFEIETKLIAIISVMELRGLKLNVDTLKQMGRTIENKMKSVELQAYQCAGKVFQINSPVQLRTILYDDLKLDQKCNIKVRETICLGAKSTSEPTLKLLAASHPLPRLILEYRHLHKALVTFVNGMLQHAKNGVIRANWEQTAAATGRISCSNPNLQTIPKNPFVLTLFRTPGSQDTETPIYLRSAYTARDGYTLVAADFQHIESRIFAHLSGDEGLMEVLRQNNDFFLTLAGKWLNKVEAAVTSVERDRTKRMVYASMYGAGTKKLMEILESDYEQTLAMMNSFSRVFPSMKAFGQKVVQKCLSEGGVLKSICGRRRMFPNIFTQNAMVKAQAERQAVNFVIQGSAADLCKIAMIITEENLMETIHKQCGLILQIHDELVWEVADEHVSVAKDVIQSAMESCGQVCNLSIPLPVSVTSGKNWAEMV